MSQLDKTIKGMKKGEVCFLMGRSGSGKTTMALNLIHNTIMNQQHNVVFNSLELNSENIVPQLLQIHSDQPEGKVANQVLNNNMENHEHFISEMNNRLRIVDAASQTADDIEQYALMANDMFDKPLSMIVIDYFGYIKSTDQGDYNEKSNIVRCMKEIDKKQDYMGFVLSR